MITQAPSDDRVETVLEGVRVLVAEDNGLLCGMLDETLREAGCQVAGPYASLERALAALSSTEIDVALLDIRLHGELVCPLASELQQRGVPFLVTSAYRSSELPHSLQSAAFLRKPFTAAEVIEGLTHLMAGRSAPGGRAESS